MATSFISLSSSFLQLLKLKTLAKPSTSSLSTTRKNLNNLRYPRGNALFSRSWLPLSGKIRGRYSRFAKQLNSSNLGVYAMDWIGTTPIPKSSEKAPMNSRFNLYKRQAKGTQILQQQSDVKRNTDSMRWHFRKRSASETESESDPEPESPSPDSAESLPPPQPPQPLSFQLPKRLKMDKTGESGVGEVAKAILSFTEAYEKAETAKLKLMMELEKERMKFAKEMELQRMQFLKTQLEISQNNQDEEERSMRAERRIIEDDDDDDNGNRDVKNNGGM